MDQLSRFYYRHYNSPSDLSGQLSKLPDTERAETSEPEDTGFGVSLPEHIAMQYLTQSETVDLLIQGFVTLQT